MPAGQHSLCPGQTNSQPFLQCLQDSTRYVLAKLTELAPLQCLQDSTCYALAKLTELAPLQCL